MLMEKEFLMKLKEFGLNSYEAKLWTALLSLGTSTAGELSDIANVPRSRSYDVLESLQKKGFIHARPGKPLKYAAIQPDEVIERMKEKVEAEASETLLVIDRLKNDSLLHDLKSMHKEGATLVDPADLSASLKGRENIDAHLSGMFKRAKKQVTIVTTESGAARKCERFAKQFADLAGRKVVVRIASPGPARRKRAADAAGIHWFSVDTPARFVTIDGKEAVFMLLDDKDVHPSYDTAVWVHAPFFASMLEKVCDRVMR